MESVLVGRGCDDGVHFAVQCQLGHRLDRVARDATRADNSIAIPVGVAAAHAPRAHRDPPMGRHRRDLVFRTNDRELGLERLN
jgi:hypothetical protein